MWWSCGGGRLRVDGGVAFSALVLFCYVDAALRIAVGRFVDGGAQRRSSTGWTAAGGLVRSSLIRRGRPTGALPFGLDCLLGLGLLGPSSFLD